MTFPYAFSIVVLGVSLSACNSMTATQVADITCIGSQTASTVAVIATTDANMGVNATKRVAQEQALAKTAQKSVSDVCPVITSGLQNIATAAAQ